ncbi:MAG: DUF1559 domain-containing protein [Planctomycetota bacterium]
MGSTGFTKADMVLVLACVVILLALLMPAVTESRGPARRNQCSTQVKNLALGAIQHEVARGVMPGYLMNFGHHSPSTAMQSVRDSAQVRSDQHRKIGTWAVALLPWLDAQPTYEHWTDEKYPVVIFDGGLVYHEFAAPNLAIMQCPSDPSSDSETVAKNSYIANVGMSYRNAKGDSPYTILTEDGMEKAVNFANSMRIANGVFHNQVETRLPNGTPAWAGPAVRLDDFKDGQGNTLLFSENLQAGPWHQIGFAEAEGLLKVDDKPWVFPAEAPFRQGMVWHWEDDQHESSPSVNALHRINGGNPFHDVMTPSNAQSLARPSSAHVEGVNAGMADGGTRFITETIDYRVYQALLTPNGTKSDVPYPEYVLAPDAL